MPAKSGRRGRSRRGMDAVSNGRLVSFNRTAFCFQIDEILLSSRRNLASLVFAMYPRWIESRVRDALADTRVVLLSGPRQAGKTTLAKMVAENGTRYLTLDDGNTLAAAQNDPAGFIRGLDRATIDEIQRVPELMLAIKQSVDEDARPGRFLLTGSANLLTIPRVADSLAGRMAIIDLLPLSVSEVQKHRSSFLQAIFEGKVPEPKRPLIGDELMGAVFSGGYPEARTKRNWSRQRTWCLDYVRAVVEQDVRDVAQIEQLQLMPRLLRILAQHSGQLVNYSQLGAALGLTHVTTQKYARIFEQLFLTRTLPPWSNNELSRLIKTPKLHFLDSGLLAALRDSSAAVRAGERGPYGALLESFVFSEVLKAASWSDQQLTFSHYRDKEQNEVDIVIENQDRKIAGLEIKASATVTSSDFAGLRKLSAATGKRFAAGLVLYDGKALIPWGPNLWAAPLSSLWE